MDGCCALGARLLVYVSIRDLESACATSLWETSLSAPNEGATMRLMALSSCGEKIGSLDLFVNVFCNTQELPCTME